MYIKEIIVVEGKDDTVKIKQAVKAETIETNGSAIDQETIEMIKHAKEKRGVIVFTDPDYPGQRIRSIIDEKVPGCKHAFLPKHKALGNRSVGVEHASVDDIRYALKKVHTVKNSNRNKFDWQPLLLKYGLMGGRFAKERRRKLGERLNIGFTNGKQLAKRLHMFEINPVTFEKVMSEIVEEENCE